MADNLKATFSKLEFICLFLPFSESVLSFEHLEIKTSLIAEVFLQLLTEKKVLT